jgi:hypothetical protein
MTVEHRARMRNAKPGRVGKCMTPPDPAEVRAGLDSSAWTTRDCTLKLVNPDANQSYS